MVKADLWVLKPTLSWVAPESHNPRTLCSLANAGPSVPPGCRSPSDAHAGLEL